VSRGRRLYQAVVISTALFNLITLTAAAPQAVQVDLTWDAPTTGAEDPLLTNLAGYKLYYGQSSRSYEFTIDIGNDTSIALSNLEAGQTYYVAVVAYDSEGVESEFSNEVSLLAGLALSIPEGLVAAYNFNEGGGATVADASGNGNDGTISGAVWTSSGRFGNALIFDGVDNSVTIEDSPSLHLSSAMTLSAWVLPTRIQSGWRTIVQRGVEAYSLHVSWEEGALRPAGGGMFDDMSAFVTVPEAIPLNTWSHLALTYDGATLRVYVNGEESSMPQTGRLKADANPLQIGGNAFYGEYFEGQIDEVRVYNRALNPSEIQADMNTPVK
jgi:hypothetical protein